MPDICDKRFKYTPSVQTNVTETMKKHGFKPTTEVERRERQERHYQTPKAAPDATVLDLVKRRVQSKP